MYVIQDFVKTSLAILSQLCRAKSSPKGHADIRVVLHQFIQNISNTRLHLNRPLFQYYPVPR